MPALFRLLCVLEALCALAVVFVGASCGPGKLAISPRSPCLGSSPRRFHHVVWIWMENKTYSQITRDSAPYMTRLAATCGLATNYFAITHPSLPNYIAATSGATRGINDDNSPSSH